MKLDLGHDISMWQEMGPCLGSDNPTWVSLWARVGAAGMQLQSSLRFSLSGRLSFAIRTKDSR